MVSKTLAFASLAPVLSAAELAKASVFPASSHLMLEFFFLVI